MAPAAPPCRRRCPLRAGECNGSAAIVFLPEFQCSNCIPVCKNVHSWRGRMWRTHWCSRSRCCAPKRKKERERPAARSKCRVRLGQIAVGAPPPSPPPRLDMTTCLPPPFRCQRFKIVEASVQHTVPAEGVWTRAGLRACARCAFGMLHAWSSCSTLARVCAPLVRVPIRPAVAHRC